MEDELEPSLRPPTQIQGRILFLTICAAGIGGTFQFGYNLSIINAPTSHIQEFTNETWQARTGEPLSDHLVLLVWSIIVSLYPLGGLFGALLAGPLAITLGRGKSQLVADVPLLCIRPGVSMNIQPMYLGESAPKELRGAVAMSSAIFTALGIVMGQVVGLRELLGDPQAWPLLLASCLVPGALQLASLPLLPESPRYLLIDCGDTEACLAALQRLRGSGDLARELEELEEERAACQGCRARRPWELFQHRALRRQVTSLVVLGSAMELCGNDLMYAYASSVFQKAGVPEAKVQYAIIGTGSCELLMAIVSVTGVDEGWRVQAGLTSTSPLPRPRQSSFPWTLYLAVACIFASILSFGIGPAGVTGILATELFDQMARPAACMVCGALMWIMLFLVSLGFPFVMVLGSLLIHRRPYPTSSMSLSLVSVPVGPSTLACSFLRPKARPSKRSPKNYTDSTSPGGPRAPRGRVRRLSSRQNSSPKGVTRGQSQLLSWPWSSLPPAFL
uniref:Major facilitator superfamily (MFS) profile domain-containing protein n=1 Tax=Colobus angolensis palliatus TaxID=336983 RepID=A0A2K5HKU6_COLAP